MKIAPLPLAPGKTDAKPVYFVEPGKLKDLENELPDLALSWAKANGFTGKAGTHCIIPDANGKVSAVVFGHGTQEDPRSAGKLASVLPQGDYRFAASPEDPHHAALGFLLGAYDFSRYRKSAKPKVRLVVPKGVNRNRLVREAEACFLARDLINTPANDFGPDALEKAARSIAAKFKARVQVTKGDQLLKKNFPMIHAVGKASDQEPRLIDMRWGNASAKKVTLVGKGVCFDSGGLNIKPGSSMTLMKKDMGGAANVLGLAWMIMSAKLPVRLRVLIPAVENAISGNAFRPGDILPSRKGITVEIGNTDAEGRLVLGDALALGDEEKPDLMIDMATLTGAARVALGPDLPPFYTDDEKLANEISGAAVSCSDPLWRMPLWKPYNSMLSSNVADTNHITSGGFAGSVTAALFLQKFVNKETCWAHFDIFGWVPGKKPWAPVGGEAQGIRALFSVIEKRYG